MGKIHENIAVIRAMKDIKQYTMADKLGMTQGAYSNIESGKTKVTFEALERIAQIFEMSVIDLIGYPKKYVEMTSDEGAHEEQVSTKDEIKAVLQLELKREKKDEILKLIFGDSCFEILK